MRLEKILSELPINKLVHIGIRHPAMDINTTGRVTAENIQLWAAREAQREYELVKAVTEVIRILRGWKVGNEIHVNTNGLNYISINLSSNALRDPHWPYREAPREALLELAKEFDINFIIGESLKRYCFHGVELEQIVEIDDGGC